MVTICIGSRQSFDRYKLDFIKKYLIETYNVQHYEEDLSISLTRQIIHTLSFVQTNKLFVITGAIRIDSQNALLKSLEELREGVHFLFWGEKEDAFLETIKSRAKVIRLIEEEDAENNAYSLLNNQGNKWEMVDIIVSYIDQHGVSAIIPALREHFLEAVNNSEQDVVIRYDLCKKMLSVLPLMENNNINSRVLIERVFE